jgi:hypothetical protein
MEEAAFSMIRAQLESPTRFERELGWRIPPTLPHLESHLHEMCEASSQSDLTFRTTVGIPASLRLMIWPCP